MATLFDTLQQRLKNQQPVAAQPQQQQIADVMRAKGGKAGGGGAPAASSLGTASAAQPQSNAISGALAAGAVGQAVDEQQAGTAAAEQGLSAQQRIAESGLAAKGTMAREGLANQTGIANDQRAAQEAAKTNAINGQVTNQLRSMATERGTTLDNIFSDFKRSDQELEFRQDAAQLEQLGFQLAMSDKSYVDELNRIGRDRNLYDELSFKEEMNTLVLGENLKSAMDELDFQKAFNADAREWEKQLTEMGSNAKIDLAKAMVADSQKQAVVSGIGSAAGAAAPYAVQYAQKPSTPVAPANQGTTQAHGGEGWRSGT